DGHVTGVQTCALPISTRQAFCINSLVSPRSCRRLGYSLAGEAKIRAQHALSFPEELRETYIQEDNSPVVNHNRMESPANGGRQRSEERRVGKEWRLWW